MVSVSTIQFGRFRLVPSERVLCDQQRPLRVGSRAFEILVVLVERYGELVCTHELLSRVWPGVVVEEATVRVHIAALRKILGDGQAGARYIINVPGRGYRFVHPVSTTVSVPARPSQEVAPARSRNLPLPLARLVGRDEAADAIAGRLSQHRLVTIVGAGGIGKTTVAITVANRLLSRYPDGVFFLDLAPLSSPDLVLTAVASALEIPLRPVDPYAGVRDFLRDRQILLVLDSCERVVDATALLAEAMLNDAADVRILVTSREPLRAEGEYVHRLAPLALPPDKPQITAEQARIFSAIQLFEARAAAVLDGFAVTDTNALAVVDVCRKLDGIPLAIELAVSRIDVLGVSGLVTRLGHRLRLLTHGRRTVLGRHRTLGAALAWSFDFLAPDEQVVLRRLSIFTGPFTLAAAQSVTAFDGIDASAVVDHVATLAMKSLIVANLDQSGTLYRLLDTTRAYASEKMITAGDAGQVAKRHVAYLLHCLSPVESDSSSQSATVPLNDHKRLIDDVRAALDWAFSSGGDKLIGRALVASAVSLWLRLSLVSECRRWIDHVLDSCNDLDPSLRMRLTAARAIVLLYTCPGVVPAEIQETWASVLKIAEKLDDVEYSLRALWGLWSFSSNTGSLPEGLVLARRFCDLAMRSSNSVDLATGDRMLAVTAHYLGDLSGAQAYVERSLAGLHPTIHGPRSIHFQYNQSLAARAYLPKILWLQGLPDAALQAARSVVDDAVEAGHALSLCLALMQAACPVALLVGHVDEAAHFVDMLLSTSASHGIDLWQTEGRCFEGAVLARGGRSHEGRRALLRAMKGPPYMESNVHRIEMLIELAHACGCVGEIQQSIDILDNALADSERRQERWCMTELLRMKAEMLLKLDILGSEPRAEEMFLDAIDWARSQGSLSWELRAATSLARLRQRQGKLHMGYICLEPVYGRFKEGFNSADLVAARRLLTELNVGVDRPASCPMA